MFIGSVPTAACYHTDLHCVGARGPARALGLCRALSKGHSWLGPGGHRKLWARPPGGEAWRIPKCAPLASSPNRVRLPTSSSSVQPRVPNHCFTIPIRLQSMGRTTARRAARSKWKLPRAIGRWRCGWVGTPVCTIPRSPGLEAGWAIHAEGQVVCAGFIDLHTNSPDANGSVAQKVGQVNGHSFFVFGQQCGDG